MNKTIFSSSFFFAFLAIFFSPLNVFAHERQVFDIGGQKYLFTVGSLNEPLAVDDKTGVDFRVKLADPKNPGDGSASGAKPATGLEQSVQVEISAGDKKKILSLEPAYNDPGAYKAVFFPTIQTTLTYRFFGTINNTPVNLSFQCDASGVKKTEEDKTETKTSAGVTRVLQVGSFGCPLAKDSLGFPENSTSLHGLHEDLHGDLSAIEARAAASSKTGTILGVVALAVSLIAFLRTRKKV
jgi:hypothetical protein